jgi:tRNA modification GTPase
MVALLTPPGKSALATLGLAGPRAWEAARELFRPTRGELPEEPEAGRFWLGRMGEEAADEVVLAVFRTVPRLVVEVHCHGGPEVTGMLLELLTGRGLVPADWQELAAARESDPLRSRAAAVLPLTATARTAGIALDQYQGAFGSELRRVEEHLVAGRCEEAKGALRGLLARADVGRHLTKPWRVVVAGAPNVGKSSLVNALAGYQRSIVAPTPGTTRDIVTTTLAFDGWPVEVSDTAGLRSEAESLEALGVEQARAAARAADLVLWVVDGSAAPVWPVGEFANLRLVVNKIDLPSAWDREHLDVARSGPPCSLGVRSAGVCLLRSGPPAPLGGAPRGPALRPPRAAPRGAVRVSAATGEGIAALAGAIGGWLVPDPPPPGSAVPFTAALIGGLTEAERVLGSDGAVEALKAVRALSP